MFSRYRYKGPQKPKHLYEQVTKQAASMLHYCLCVNIQVYITAHFGLTYMVHVLM